MFESLGHTAESLAGAVGFLLPGFLAISSYEATSPSIARNRSVWHWTMWSLTVSLLLVAVIHRIYKEFGWPRETTDPEFYGALIGVAIVGGYACGRVSAFSPVRQLVRRSRFLQPRWIWFEVMREPERYIIVHLRDGTVLYGYPRKCTDDSREDTREVFLTDAHILVKSRHGSDVWMRFPDTDGVLVESPDNQFVQLLA